MKAMIFAAGIGSRLKPFTDSHPKALLPVGGVPMLGRVLDSVRHAGIGDVVVNVHHFASQVKEYLTENAPEGMKIAVSDESDCLLDTGGGLLKAAGLLDYGSEGALLHNADILTDVDLSRMIEAHKEMGADVTLLMSTRDSSRLLYFDEKGRLKGWRNVKTVETIPSGLEIDGLVPMAFGGVHVVSKAVFPLLEEYARDSGPVFSMTPFYLANIGNLDIRAYVPDADYLWHDVGSPEKYRAAEAALAKRPL